MSFKALNLENTPQKRYVTSQKDTLEGSDYGIRLELKAMANRIAMRRSVSLFINTANALYCPQCAPANYVPEDSIASIQIIDLEKFDAEMTENTDVTSHFQVVNGTESLPVTEFKRVYPWFQFNNDNTGTALFNLVLKNPPQITGKHQFKLVLQTKNGVKIENTSPSVVLN